MRTSSFVLLALLAVFAGCEPEQDLGTNDPHGAAGNSASGAGGSAQAGSAGNAQAGQGGSAQAGGGGSSQAGSAQAGGGGSDQAGGGSAQAGSGGSSQAGSGGSSQAGSGGSSQAGSAGSAQAGSSQGGSAGAALSCPPSVQAGKLAPVPYASGYLGMANDLRFGASHRYLLEDPWVDVDSFSGDEEPMSFTLTLNQNYRALAVMAGSVQIPPAWGSFDKISALPVQKTNETMLVLKAQPVTYSFGRVDPGLVVEGTDVYWSLQVPARVVEAPLGGSGAERVVVEYDEASQTAPIGLAVDDQYVYWTTGKISQGMLDASSQLNKVFRARRHDPGSKPEELAAPFGLMTTLLVDGDSLHVGFAAGNGGGSAGGTLPKAGGTIREWGSDVTSFRVGRMAVLGEYVYYTEQANPGCHGRLRRYKPSSTNQLFKAGELLIDGMYSPTNLIAHDGKLYFTTDFDPFGGSGSGGVFAYEPSAPVCLSCGEVFASGAKSAVCDKSEQAFSKALVCGLQNGCQNSCLLPSGGEPLPDACKSCLEAKCPSEVAACKADKGG